ncbi:MAG: hypothetical protein GX285_07780 [Clostridiales bacterium]|nr:hypothetical protein [Clostridiales bacterium]
MIYKGIMLSEVPFGNLPIMMKNAGFDFFIIDCEHSGFDYKDIARMIITSKLCGIKAYIRLPDNSRRDITRFLDMGADGLLLPMTNILDDIRQVVKYAKYDPKGKRGISVFRAHTFYNPPNMIEYMARANENVKVFAQIETKEGLNNLDEIISCDGVDGIFIGPNDLACDLKCLNEPTSTLILNAISNAVQKSKEYKKLCGIISSNTELLKYSKAQGMSAFCVGSELSILIQGLQSTSHKIDNL